MTTYATLTDVTDRWGKSASGKMATLINVRLGDVERMILRRFKAAGLVLADEISSTRLDVEDVKQVEAEAVLRLVRNPEGFASETDGDYTYEVIQALASGVLEITPEEWEILGITSQTGMFLIVPVLSGP
jgi:hypothetical protein